MLEKLSNLPLPGVQYGKIDGIHSTTQRVHTSALRALNILFKTKSNYNDTQYSSIIEWKVIFFFFYSGHLIMQRIV